MHDDAMEDASLGERLRQLRQEAGLSLRDLARRVGVTFPHLSKVEAGRERPSADLLTKVAAALDADPDELLLLAGRLPEDVAQIVADKPEIALQFLRSWKAGTITDEDVRRMGRPKP